MDKIGDIIRYHRKKAKLSRIDLGKISGVGKTVIFDIEKGKKTIKLDTLLRILDALNIKLVPQSPLMEEYEKSLNKSQ